MFEISDISVGFLSIFVVVGTPLLGMFAIRRWRRGLHAQSVFKDADDFEDVGLTILNSVGQFEPRKLFDGKKEYRTAWGYSVFTPIVLIAVLSMVPWAEVWEGFRIDSSLVRYLISGLFCAILLHAWVWLSFFHRLSYDNSTISVVGETFKKSTQRMVDLDSVEIVPQRPLLILKFRTGANFKVSRSMSGVSVILDDLNKQIQMNTFLRARTAG